MNDTAQNQSDAAATASTADKVASFEDQIPPSARDGRAFMVDLAGFEGPLDLLLTLARKQKVDLTQVSILQLAEQYLTYIAEARKLRIEIAADYLVMAAWLAYLKSRLLIPSLEEEDEPSADELADRLAHQLRRLEAMREAAQALFRRHRLGVDVFPRGRPEGVRVIRKSAWQCDLYDLLKAYGDQANRNLAEIEFRLRPVALMSVEDAVKRLRSLVGHVQDWASLETFLPEELKSGIEGRSARASTFVALLELSKEGQVKVRQSKQFGPIFLRGAQPT